MDMRAVKQDCMVFTLSDGTEIELRLPRKIAVRVPMQSGPDWLFEAIQAAVWRSRAGMTKGELESERS
jgi:hypothetical protein